MGDNNPSPTTLGFNTNGSATTVKITSIAMVLTVIFLFLVVIFVFFLYLYTRYYWSARSIARRRTARAHFIFVASDASLLTLGLDPSILLSLPITIYRSNDFKEGLECAVCLSELIDGEKARLLPNCNHGFHLECIDMWFHSHSTCPLCRSPVGGEDGLHLTESVGSDIERSGLQGQRMLAISIPVRSTEMFLSSLSPLTSSRSQVQEMMSPVEESRSPGMSKVGSLKRILSRGKRIGGSCCSSPGLGDIEQGLVGYGEVNGEGTSVFQKTPKIPTL